MGNALIDELAIVNKQDAAHHDGPHRKAAAKHAVCARQEEERCLQQLLDEHANRAHLETARRSQRHLVEHAAHA